jgi:hypothetical protein
VADTSDLSGRPIAADERTTLRIALPDGRRRELVVRGDEAADLGGKGRDVAGFRRKALKAIWPFGRWVLISVLGVLAVQGIAKQSADRQKELELKRDLASDIGSSSFSAYSTARSLVYRAPPEKRAAARAPILTDWIAAEGRIDGVFHAYLSPSKKHSVTRDWVAFRGAVYTYLRLSCCRSERQRDKDLEAIAKYLRDHDVPGFPETLEADQKLLWSALRGDPTSPTYPNAYDWLGREVVEHAPWRAIRHAQPEGFSNGFGDFLHDAIPGY